MRVGGGGNARGIMEREGTKGRMWECDKEVEEKKKGWDDERKTLERRNCRYNKND